MRNEHETAAIADPCRAPNGPLGIGGKALLLSSPGEKAAVMHRFRRLDVERRALREQVQRLENLLVLFPGEIVGGQSAAGHYQEKDAPHARLPVLDQRSYLRQVAHIASSDGGLHLRLETNLASFGERFRRALEGARHAAEAVVGSRVVAVYADCHTRHAT